MMELQGLIFPSGLMKDILAETDIPIRQTILARVTEDQQPIFLSITKKWGSPNWQATYAKYHKLHAKIICSLPGSLDST